MKKIKSRPKSQLERYVDGRLGLVVDGTAANYTKIMREKKILETLGYDTMMVAVSVPVETAVERNIGPDANITLDFALVRLANILDKMIIYPKKMIQNINLTKGLIFSQEVMLELTKSGLSREKSYKIVQNYSKKCFSENINF